MARVLRLHPGGVSSEELAGALRAQGGKWDVTVRQALGAPQGGPPSASCFRELRHTFLCVTAAQRQQFIVDVRFKESFAIGRAATLAYAHLLAQVRLLGAFCGGGGGGGGG